MGRAGFVGARDRRNATKGVRAVTQETDALDLSGEEVDALSYRLIARRLEGDWLMWEDVPNLSERSFMRLQDAVDDLARDAWSTSQNLDGLRNIDSAYLMEQATE